MLESERLILRGVEPEDVNLLYDWENNRAFWRVSLAAQPFSKETVRNYLRSVTDIYSDQQLRLIICDKKTMRPIGSLDLFDCDFKSRRCGMGILIADESDRKKGYAIEALKQTLDYCEKILNLHQVFANIFIDNDSSISLFEKAGFSKVGIKRDWTFSDGLYRDELLMQKILGND